MPINLNKISKQAKPKFISRKKRSELNAIKSVLASVPLKPEPPAEAAPETEEPADSHVEIPQWRLQPDEAPQQIVQTSWTKSLDQMTERDWRIVVSDLGISYSEQGSRPLRSWSDANLHPPFKEPTPIQAAAIPLLLAGRDVIGIAPTGSGKTLAFSLPIKPQIHSALILSPTRELALQTCKLLSSLKVKNTCLIGGHEMDAQLEELADACAIVATPGRLIDFLDNDLLSLSTIKYFVCDEADRMLDMGFGPQLEQITAALATAFESPQTAMFTATWEDATASLATKLLKSPVTIRIGATLNPSIHQDFEWVEDKKKRAVELIRTLPKPTMVFCNTKASCDTLESLVPNSVALHSSRSQQAREDALAQFKSRNGVLIATDVMGRGIDIKGVASVLNYDMPHQVDTYVHRVGRTGRAGRKGRAYTFLEDKDTPLLDDLRKLLRKAGVGTVVPRKPTG